jgi:hypothetical protein
MRREIIDLRDPYCWRCGTPLGVLFYYGDRSLLRCEECARQEPATIDLSAGRVEATT